MEEQKETSAVSPKKDNKALKGLINDIFETNGRARVKKFAKEFSDGRRFADLFNLLFDQQLSIPFSADGTLEDKVQNWNKINAMICFNYLQQDFYLGASTMTALAKGDSLDTLMHILRLLVNSSQLYYHEAIVDEANKAEISDTLIRGAKESGISTDVRFIPGGTDPTGKFFIYILDFW